MVRSLLLVLLATLAVSAQAQVSIRVTIRMPAPAELSTWQRDPSVAQISIKNTGQGIKRARVSIEIQDEGGKVVASTDDNATGIPRFTVAGGGAVTTLSGRDVLNTAAIRINKALYRTAAQTNSLPEGDYTRCVRLLQDDGSDVEGATEACANVSIVIADPPRLVLPASDQELETDRVQFQWTPVIAAGATGIRYELTVVQLGAKDDPAVAIDRNEKLLVKTINRTDYLMTALDRGLAINGARRFAWRIRAVTATGQAATSNNGLSEVGTFSIALAGKATQTATRTRPDTIVMSGYKIAVSSWLPRNANGTYSGSGCLVLACDQRTNKPIDIPDVERSMVKRKGYNLRTMTVVDDVKDPATELSRKDLVKAAGSTFKAGQKITVPIRTDMAGFDTEAAGKAIIGALSDLQRDCHPVDFVGVFLNDTASATVVTSSGTINYPGSPLVDMPMRWYPTDSFVVVIDTMQITPSIVGVGGYAYHVSALLGYGTGDPGVFPFSIRDGYVTDPCSFYAMVRGTTTQPMFIGESQCVVTAEEYLLDFTKTWSGPGQPDARLGITIGKLITVGKTNTWTNQGFLRLNMIGRANILDSGITAQLQTSSTDPNRNMHFTTIPVRHQFAYDSVLVRFKNSTFAGADYKGALYTDTVHASHAANTRRLILNRVPHPIDADYTIRFRDVLDTTMPAFWFCSPDNRGKHPYIFTVERGPRAKVFGRYPATWVAPQRWSPFSMPPTADLVSSGGFVGILLDDGCKLGVTIDGRDVGRQPFYSGFHVGGRAIIGPDGITAGLTYKAVIDTARLNAIDIGRLSSPTYDADSARFSIWGSAPDTNNPTAPKHSVFAISFNGSAVDSTVIQGVGRVVNTPTRFMVDHLVLTSLADVPAPFINMTESQRTSNPWNLSIEPVSTTQTHMGYAVATHGFLQITGSVLREPVHFSQPFKIMAMELLANGGSGRLALDFNAAGQTFDGFPYTPEQVRLSPLPTAAGSEPYLATSGNVSYPFFGANYLHVLDVSDTSRALPFYGRRIVLRTTPFMGFAGTTVSLRKESALARFAFDITYNDAAQFGFQGTGIVDLFAIGPTRATVLINPEQLCFQAKAEVAATSELNDGLSTFGALADIWACGCAENDAMNAIAAGGRIAMNGSALFGLGRAGGGLEATLGLRPNVATFWISGGAMLNGLLLDNDQHMLVTGVVNKRERFARATVYLSSTWALPVGGAQSDTELDFFSGIAPNLQPMAYFQGRGSVEMQFASLTTNASSRKEAGLFLGTNVPKEKAWILYATDGRFRLRDEFIPDLLSGLYVYGTDRSSLDLALISGRIDTHVGFGGFTEGVGITGGVDVHGRIFGGLIYASAMANLQLAAGGADSGLYGRLALQGCINTIIWDSYCASLDLGVGMTTSRGLYIE